MRAGRDGLRDFLELQTHRLGGAAREHQTGAFAVVRADRSEHVGGLRSRIARCRRTGAAFGPPAGDLVLLTDSSLVTEPDLYGLAAGLTLRDRRQMRGEVFLKAATAASLLA